jgi:hypothetical protein
MPRSSKWSLPFMFTTQNTVWISQLSHAWYKPGPCHPPSFDHPNNIWWSIQVMKFLIMQPNRMQLFFTNKQTEKSYQIQRLMYTIIFNIIIHIITCQQVTFNTMLTGTYFSWQLQSEVSIKDTLTS